MMEEVSQEEVARAAAVAEQLKSLSRLRPALVDAQLLAETEGPSLARKIADLRQLRVWLGTLGAYEFVSEDDTAAALADVEKLLKAMDDVDKKVTSALGFVKKVLEQYPQGIDFGSKSADDFTDVWVLTLDSPPKADDLAAVAAMAEPAPELAKEFHADVTAHALETSNAIDAIIEKFKAVIVNTVKRAVTLTHSKKLTVISWVGQTVIGFEREYTRYADPFSEKIASALKALTLYGTEALKEISIQVDMASMTVDEALAKLGPLDIAKAAAEDIMRGVETILISLDLVIPKWSWIEGPLKVAIETVVKASITKAEALERIEELGEQRSAFYELMGGLAADLEEAFKEKAVPILIQGLTGAPTQALETSIATGVKIVVNRIIEKLPIEPAKKYTKTDIQTTLKGANDVYTAGLLLKDSSAQEIAQYKEHAASH